MQNKNNFIRFTLYNDNYQAVKNSICRKPLFFADEGDNFIVDENDNKIFWSIVKKYESQYNKIDDYAIVLVNGEALKFFANIDTPVSDTNFWGELVLFNLNMDIVKFNLGTITILPVTGGNKFYVDQDSLEIGSIESGIYFIGVLSGYDPTKIYYLSNPVFVASNALDYTNKIRYRNNKNILHFEYESLTSFKNEFRIKLVKRQPNFPTRQIGYDLVSGSFNPVRTTKGSQYQFITEAYSKYNHEAWNASTIQELEVYDENEMEWQLFKRGESTYEVDWSENYPLADGTIELEQSSTFSSNKSL